VEDKAQGAALRFRFVTNFFSISIRDNLVEDSDDSFVNNRWELSKACMIVVLFLFEQLALSAETFLL